MEFKNMIKSIIYKDIESKALTTNDLQSLGYFVPNDGDDEFKKLDENFNCVVNSQGQPIKFENSEPIIGYFTGSFSYFHKGHIEIIKQFVLHLKEKHPKDYLMQNYYIVIAPAHTDYLATKYPDSQYIQNKQRYDQIIEQLQYQLFRNIVLDLNPMLNCYQDYNFTDLLFDFLNRNQIENSTNYILCGKDRAYFKNIEKYTNKLKVFYCDSFGDISSRAHIEQHPKPFTKKTLFLRCWKESEFKLFKDFFAEQYQEIIPIYIHDEIEFAKQQLKDNPDLITICKDYQHLMPYIQFSRKQLNPLADYYHDKPEELSQKVVIDSDSYSGETRKTIESLNSKLICYKNLNHQTDKYELLDIDDFYEDDFCYPYVDISSKCSMQPFLKKDYLNFNQFKKALKNERNYQ